jgi:uncharacterized membrane protein YfcA
MPSADIALTVAAILFAGFLLQSTIGFGSALVVMPLLGALLGVRTATAIVGILSVVSSLIITLVDRRHINLRRSWQLTVASFIGVPVGLLVLQTVPNGIILKGLGAVLITYGAFSLLSARMRLDDRRDYGWLAWPLGFVSGVLGSAYIFFTSGIIIAFGQWAAGLWTTQALTLAALSAPALPFAILLGRWLNARIPQAVFTQVLYVFLIVLGMRLLFS